MQEVREGTVGTMTKSLLKSFSGDSRCSEGGLGHFEWGTLGILREALTGVLRGALGTEKNSG